MYRISEVERLASLLFSEYEIGLLTGDEERNKADDFQAAMLRGRLKSEVAVREAILQDAQAGNPPALSLVQQLITQNHAA